MTVTLDLDDTELRVTLTGLDMVLAFARRMVIPVAAIIGARVIARDDAKQDLGWRVGGGYLPGLLATGWYTMRTRKGDRQWWSVYRDRELLSIDTSLQRPARVVLQTDRRHELAGRIQTMVQRREAGL